jgi:hypothetical protein
VIFGTQHMRWKRLLHEKIKPPGILGGNVLRRSLSLKRRAILALISTLTWLR